MAADNQDLTLTIKANTAGAQQGIDGLGSSFSRLTGAFVAGGLITSALQKTMGFLEGTVTDSIKAWNESERMVAQLNAVLKSTQHAAGLSAQSLIDLSQSLQKTTTFSDEAVLSVENLLLTFTNITGPTFEKATSTVLDMATALGEDTSSAAIQLGKALQDPILGITALRRVGVNFTSSQQEMIAGLVKTGKTMEAQTIILKELDKEFGGSATAAAKTFEGQMKQVANKVDDIQETIGHGLTGALDAVFIAFNQTTDAMNSNVDMGKIVFDIFSSITEFAANTATGIHSVAAAVVDLGSYVAEGINLIIAPMEAGKTMQFWSDFRTATNDGAKATADFAMNLHDQNTKMSSDWGKMTEDAKTYSTKGPSAYEQTATAAADAAAKIKDANKAIADTNTKLNDLIETRDKEVFDSRKSLAEEYVAEQKRIADLRKELTTATGFEQIQNLNIEITANQKAFDSKKQIEKDYVAEVAEARRRASETEFERTIEDINNKAVADKKAFEKKRDRIFEEMALDSQKLLALAGNEKSLTKTTATESAKRVATATAEADAIIAQAARAKAAQVSAYAGFGTGGLVPATTTYSIGGVSTPAIAKHEAGGFVNAPRGTEVPIIAHGGEEVIPAELVGSNRGNNVTVVIQNPSVRNDSDLDNMRRMIEDIMRPLLLNAKVIHI